MDVILQTNLKYVYENGFLKKGFMPAASNFDFLLTNARN